MIDKPRILILGAAGQVGLELARSFAGLGEIVTAERKTGDERVDLADEQQTRALVRRVQPNLVLNAAAYTAVDRAETERELADAVNGHAPGVLAEEARRLNAVFVHYSTDYVFDGSRQQPWTETDLPSPLNAYGAGKLAGERAVLAVGGRSLIFRTSWVYGPHGNNFLLTMLRLAGERDQLSIVADQFGSPTSSIEIARATRQVVEGLLAGRFDEPGNWAGLYHMTCGGSTSWFGFAQTIFACAGKLPGGNIPQLTAIPASQYPAPAKRPAYSVLSSAKLQAQFGVKLNHWEAALDEVMAALATQGECQS